MLALLYVIVMVPVVLIIDIVFGAGVEAGIVLFVVIPIIGVIGQIFETLVFPVE